MFTYPNDLTNYVDMQYLDLEKPEQEIEEKYLALKYKSNFDHKEVPTYDVFKLEELGISTAVENILSENEALQDDNDRLEEIRLEQETKINKLEQEIAELKLKLEEMVCKSLITLKN